MDILNLTYILRFLTFTLLLFSCTDTKRSVPKDKYIFMDTLDGAISLVYEGRPSPITKPFVLADSTFTVKEDGFYGNHTIMLDINISGEIPMPKMGSANQKHDYINAGQWVLKGNKSDSITAVVQTSRVLLDVRKGDVFYMLSLVGKGDSGGIYKIGVKKDKGKWKIAGLTLAGVY